MCPARGWAFSFPPMEVRMIRFYKNCVGLLLCATALQAMNGNSGSEEARRTDRAIRYAFTAQGVDQAAERIKTELMKALAKGAEWPAWKKVVVTAGAIGILWIIYSNWRRFYRGRPDDSDDELVERRVRPSIQEMQAQAAVPLVSTGPLAPARRREQRVTPPTHPLIESGQAPAFLAAIEDPRQVLAFLRTCITHLDAERTSCSEQFKHHLVSTHFLDSMTNNEQFKLGTLRGVLADAYNNQSVARLVHICTDITPLTPIQRLEQSTLAGMVEIRDPRNLFQKLYYLLEKLTFDKPWKSRRVAACAIVDAAVTAIAEHDFDGNLEAAKAALLLRLKTDIPDIRGMSQEQRAEAVAYLQTTFRF